MRRLLDKLTHLQDDAYTCRICKEKNPGLYVLPPCECGTYMHRLCVLEAFFHPTKQSLVECPVCKYNCIVEPPSFAKYVCYRYNVSHPCLFQWYIVGAFLYFLATAWLWKCADDAQWVIRLLLIGYYVDRTKLIAYVMNFALYNFVYRYTRILCRADGAEEEARVRRHGRFSDSWLWF